MLKLKRQSLTLTSAHPRKLNRKERRFVEKKSCKNHEREISCALNMIPAICSKPFPIAFQTHFFFLISM